MSIDPVRGMTPDDWAEMEARRLERRQRVHNEHGRAPSRATRLVLGWILGLGLVAAVVYTILALVGVVPLPGPG